MLNAYLWVHFFNIRIRFLGCVWTNLTNFVLSLQSTKNGATAMKVSVWGREKVARCLWDEVGWTFDQKVANIHWSASWCVMHKISESSNFVSHKLNYYKNNSSIWYTRYGQFFKIDLHLSKSFSWIIISRDCSNSQDIHTRSLNMILMKRFMKNPRDRNRFILSHFWNHFDNISSRLMVTLSYICTSLLSEY